MGPADMDAAIDALHTLASGEHGAHLDDGLIHGLASNEQEPEPRCILGGGLHQIALAKDEGLLSRASGA